ncbi:MAG: ABC transporter substrate-binding protein [Ruminiclostridium sp.]
MKKKLLSIVLAVSTMMSLAACGSSSTAENTSGVSQSTGAASTSNSGEAKHLTVWTINKNEAATAVINDAIANFKKSNNVDVEFQYFENDPYKTKLKTVMGSGEAPDMFHSWGGSWLKQFVDEDQVLPITEQTADFKSQLSEAAWDLDTFDGQVYAVPYVLTGTVVYYNKALFEKYGLTFPKTWEELVKVSTTFKDKGIIPFALGNKAAWPGAMHFIYQYIRYGGKDSIITSLEDKGNGVFNKDAFINAGKNMKQMVDNEWFPAGANGINYDTGGDRMLFYQGKAAMILQTGSLSSACKDESPDFYAKNLAVAPFPTVEGGKGTTAESLCGNNALSISKNCKNPEDAIAFLKYFTTDKGLNERNANEAGILIATKGIEIKDPIVNGVMDILSKSTSVQNFFDQGLPSEVAKAFNDSTQALIGGAMSPEDVYKKCEDTAQKLLKK